MFYPGRSSGPDQMGDFSLGCPGMYAALEGSSHSEPHVIGTAGSSASSSTASAGLSVTPPDQCFVPDSLLSRCQPVQNAGPYLPWDLERMRPENSPTSSGSLTRRSPRRGATATSGGAWRRRGSGRMARGTARTQGESLAGRRGSARSRILVRRPTHPGGWPRRPRRRQMRG